MGMPLKPCVSFVFNKSSTVLSGAKQTGSLIKPCSYFLTRLIWAACSSAVLFEWMMPIPPISAIAIAISHSVTVSIGEETSGVFLVVFNLFF